MSDKLREACEAFKAAADGSLKDADNLGDVTMALAPLPPAFLGRLVMWHLPRPDVLLDLDTKLFWCEVANTLGPDWIAEWNRIGAFMNTVDEF